MCSHCTVTNRKQAELIFARTGVWHKDPEWQIRQIERDKKFAVELVEKLREDLTSANNL